MHWGTLPCPGLPSDSHLAGGKLGTACPCLRAVGKVVFTSPAFAQHFQRTGVTSPPFHRWEN